ncbi:MAG: RdgB/HAM1 family non-canonical purine NTP pyrophosphatase [Ignavibacteriales bacterium]|nr:RdgB/HAM1 family non-canonical purine NTP pyrophosphatase [Ignavibacteriales bacterium]
MSEKVKIIFASRNPGKVREVTALFKDTNFIIKSLLDFNNIPEIIEDGKTFEENALLKAKIVFEQFRCPVIADDSGLEVEQIKNEPGVYSARYAGGKCSYYDNNVKLLYELQFYDEPHFAKFVCYAIYYSGDKRIDAKGELIGRIINEFRGDNGFGYDPIFIPEGYGLTLAELTLLEKNKISHRAKAFNELKLKMLETIK